MNIYHCFIYNHICEAGIGTGEPTNADRLFSSVPINAPVPVLESILGSQFLPNLAFALPPGRQAYDLA